MDTTVSAFCIWSKVVVKVTIVVVAMIVEFGSKYPQYSLLNCEILVLSLLHCDWGCPVIIVSPSLHFFSPVGTSKMQLVCTLPLVKIAIAQKAANHKSNHF